MSRLPKVDKPSPLDCFDVAELQARIIKLHAHLEGAEQINEMLYQSNEKLWALADTRHDTAEKLGNLIEKQQVIISSYQSAVNPNNRLN